MCSAERKEVVSMEGEIQCREKEERKNPGQWKRKPLELEGELEVR